MRTKYAALLKAFGWLPMAAFTFLVWIMEGCSPTIQGLEHSTLGYQSPAQFKNEFYANKNLSLPTIH
jgi:hypothetical protein